MPDGLAYGGARSLCLWALPEIPLVQPGDDLAEIISSGLARMGAVLEAGDILVVAQKIISKAENRYRYLDDVGVTPEAQKLAVDVDKDPRLVQLILDESSAVIAQRPGVLIVEHREGYIHANAGIDRSNIDSTGRERVLLLPEDSNASARRLREALGARLGIKPGVIINDSAGRPWRMGIMGFALGSAGVSPLKNMVGQTDLFGRALEVTEIAVADELAAAASFLMGQANEGAPVILIRGAGLPSAEEGCEVLIRPREQDLFRHGR